MNKESLDRHLELGRSNVEVLNDGQFLAREFSLSELWIVLYRRRGLVSLVVLACCAMSAAYCIVVKPRYTAVAQMSFDPGKTDSFNLQDVSENLMGGGDVESRIETEVHILQSQTLAWAAMDKLQLYKDPNFIAVGTADLSRSSLHRDRLLSAWFSGLSVKAIPKTNLIEVSFRSRSAELSAKAVNGLIDSYVERNFRVKFESTMQVSDWLSRQLEDIRAKTKDAEQRLIDYQKNSGLIVWSQPNSNTPGNLATDSLQELNRALTTAEADRIVKEARYRVAISGDQKALTDLVPGSALLTLQARRAELASEYAQAEPKFGAAFPKIKQLKAQMEETDTAIRNETKNLTTRMEQEYVASQKGEQMLQAQVEKQKAAAFKFNEGAVQLQILEREAASNRELYEGLLKKLKEAGVVAGLKSTNITVVDYATAPERPSDPKVLEILILGLMGGLILGLALAFVRENLHDVLNTSEEAEMCSGLPSLVTVPIISSAISTPKVGRGKQQTSQQGISRVSLDSPKSHAAEAFRALRTSLLLSRSEEPPRTIVVTSSFPGEGKSTISLNTAIVLAQDGGRVLLVDGDMRRSILNRKLGIKSESGLSTVLTGSTTMLQAIVQIAEVKGLSLLPAGPVPPNPAELLRSRAVKQLLQDCKKEFDFVVIDTPPVLIVTDAVILAAEADCTILVMWSGKTSSHALLRARNTLLRSNASIAGIAVNAVDTKSPDYYHSDYGSYYEAYSDKA
jgi:succinoglycan biosynthesis transport protein ExoP